MKHVPESLNVKSKSLFFAKSQDLADSEMKLQTISDEEEHLDTM